MKILPLLTDARRSVFPSQHVLHADLSFPEMELAEARQNAIQSRDTALEASRAKSHLLASVSHELRTPMNAILGFSDVMKRQTFGPIKHVHLCRAC